MARHSFQDFFDKYPLVFKKYYEIAEHPKNFYQQLEALSLFSNLSSILSIGAGEGELEVRVAAMYKAKLGYIDPSRPYFEAFRQKVIRAGIQSQVIEEHNDLFQTYESKHKYDLVISSHSWYAFGLDRRMLDKALGGVVSGGHLFITLLSDKSITYDLGCLLRDFNEGHLTSERLSTWSAELGYDHRYVMNEKAVDWSIFFDGDRITQSAMDFISFLVTTPWDEIPEEIKEAAVRLFYKHRSGDAVILRSGCLLFNQNGSGKYA